MDTDRLTRTETGRGTAWHPCGIMGMGLPFHIDFLGSTTFDQVGPMLALLGVVAALGWLAFRRRPVTRPTVTPEVATAMWEDLEDADEVTPDRELTGAATD